jgi:flavin-dependent dehydrogenase
VVREGWDVLSPVVEDGLRVRGVLARPAGSAGPAARILAPVVVAADGRRSRIHRALHPGSGDPTRTRPGSWFGLKTHFARGPRSLGPRIELHLIRRGYAGICAVEGGRVNLCLMVAVSSLRACGGSPERVLLERVLDNPAAREALCGLDRVSPWRSIGPLAFGTRHAASRGALFVGDAAGTIDPFCGAGIAHALRSAELALPFAARAAVRGGLDEELARGYRDAWHQAFVPVTRRVRLIRPLLERAALGGAVIGILSRLGLDLPPRLVAATRTRETSLR